MTYVPFNDVLFRWMQRKLLRGIAGMLEEVTGEDGVDLDEDAPFDSGLGGMAGE